MATRKPSPANQRMQAFKDIVDYGTPNKSGLKQTTKDETSLTEAQKLAAYRASLTKSTTTDPTTLKEYTTLTDKEGKVKDVSYHWGDKGGSLNTKQKAALEYNIKTHALNEQRKAAYKKQEELHGKDSKQYKAVTEAAPLSTYMEVTPSMR
jgi:hypothetical protein